MFIQNSMPVLGFSGVNHCNQGGESKLLGGVNISTTQLIIPCRMQNTGRMFHLVVGRSGVWIWFSGISSECCHRVANSCTRQPIGSLWKITMPFAIGKSLNAFSWCILVKQSSEILVLIIPSLFKLTNIVYACFTPYYSLAVAVNGITPGCRNVF